MNEKNYQKLAELVGRSPRLLGPGGLFGGLNQEHGLMVDFIKFVRGLKIGNNMSPETVNIRSFVAYLGERKNAEDVARKLYDMRQNGEIVEDIQSRERNTLFNLAETLFDLGVGENPENVGGDYEGILRETLSRHGDAGIGAKADGKKGPGNVQNFLKKQPSEISKGEREIASPETPLSTMGGGLTDEGSIARVEAQAGALDIGTESQTGALAIGAETQTGALAVGRAAVTPTKPEERRLLSEEEAKAKKDETATAPESAQAEEPLKTEGATPAPGRDDTSTEGDLQPGAEEISGDTLGESGLLRPLTAPVIGEAAGQAASRPAGQATGEALAGTRAAPGGERRRIVAELPGEGRGRMLQKGPKKQKQGQGREQGRGAGESRRDQGRQTGPGRTPGQDFANQQAARPQKSGVGGKVAGGAGAGIAGLALIKGMYGGAAANAASFGILQTILDLLT